MSCLVQRNKNFDTKRLFCRHQIAKIILPHKNILHVYVGHIIYVFIRVYVGHIIYVFIRVKIFGSLAPVIPLFLKVLKSHLYVS
jgi:hypothetical protein